VEVDQRRDDVGLRFHEHPRALQHRERLLGRKLS
jgi:hypothetical protein